MELRNTGTPVQKSSPSQAYHSDVAAIPEQPKALGPGAGVDCPATAFALVDAILGHQQQVPEVGPNLDTTIL